MIYSKPTLLVVTDYYSIGGTKTYIEGVGEVCKRIGIELIVVAFTDKSQNGDQLYKNISNQILLQIPKLSFYSIPIRVFRLIPVLKKIVSKYSKLTIVSDLILPACSLIYAKKILKIKHDIFYQFHGLNTLERQSAFEYDGKIKKISIRLSQRIRRHIEVFTLTRVNRIYCFSEYAKSLLKLNISKKLPVVKINPGLDSELANISKKITKKIARNKLGISMNKQIILYVGRLEPRKGIYDFVENLKTVKKSFFNNKVLIFVSSYKDDFSSYDLFRLHENTQLGSKFFFINAPTREQLSCIYTASDVLVLPSTSYETFGFVTLESLICNTPVVGFDIGANSELIVAELLVKNKSGFAGLIKKVEFCLRKKVKDQSKRKSIHLYEKYSWDKYVDCLLSN